MDVKDYTKKIMEKLVSLPTEILEKVSDNIDKIILNEMEFLNESTEELYGLYDVSKCNLVELTEKLDSEKISYKDNEANNMIHITSDDSEKVVSILTECGAEKTNEKKEGSEYVLLIRETRPIQEKNLPNITWEDIND